MSHANVEKKLKDADEGHTIWSWVSLKSFSKRSMSMLTSKSTLSVLFCKVSSAFMVWKIRPRVQIFMRTRPPSRFAPSYYTHGGKYCILPFVNQQDTHNRILMHVAKLYWLKTERTNYPVCVCFEISYVGCVRLSLATSCSGWECRSLLG